MHAALHTTAASAPGTLMLMGEHAVLHGHHALCAAINQRITVHLLPDPAPRLRLQSALGEFETPLSNLQPAPPFTFVIDAVRQANLPRYTHNGLLLRIEADFAHDLGFGSSAAVTIATLTALQAAQGEPLDRAAIFAQALKVLHNVQGRGSGADLAAATYGGIVRYCAHPLEIEPLIRHLPLSAHYLGYKTPTTDVIRCLDQKWADRPTQREDLFRQIGQLTNAAARAIRSGDLPSLADAMNQHHTLQVALGCADPQTHRLHNALRQQPGILAAKISGSGLGDCLIALGTPTPQIPDFPAYPLSVSEHGTRVHS